MIRCIDCIYFEPDSSKIPHEETKAFIAGGCKKLSRVFIASDPYNECFPDCPIKVGKDGNNSQSECDHGDTSNTAYTTDNYIAMSDIKYEKTVITGFLKELLQLAEIAADNDSDNVSFDIGSANGYTLSADITFTYTKEQK